MGWGVSESGIRRQRSGDTLHVTLDRPERRNAIGAAEFNALEGLIAELANDRDVTLVTITGSGPVFCAGADLALVRKAQEEIGGALRQVDRGSALIEGLERLPQMVVASLNGPAVGLGLHIALAADFIIAERGAFLWLPEAAMGLPEVMCQRLLTERLGRHRAFEVTALGLRVTAEEAQAAGLVGACVDGQDGLTAASAELCERLRQVSPVVRAVIKQAGIAAGSRFDRDAQLRAVAATQRNT